MPLVEVAECPPQPVRHDSLGCIREKEKDRVSQRDYAAPEPGHFGKDLWDPNFAWTEIEEKRVVRKTDWRLLFAFCIIVIAIQIDRGNLTNVLTDNFLNDAHLSQTDYDNGLMLSRIGVLLSEFPVQFLVLRYGFRNVFPPIILIWGIISGCQALIKGKESFLFLRFAIGLVEGGYWPGMVYFFTQFYTNAELTPRLAALAAMSDLASILSSLFAAGILEMRGVLGHPGWWWLFLFEGVAVFVIGILAYLYLPSSPTSTRSTLHRGSWYNTREELIVVNRVLRDDSAKGQVAHEAMPTMQDVIHTWKDKTLWIFYAVSLLGIMAYLPVKQYLSLMLRRMGFSTFESNMLAVPCGVLQMITVLVVSWSSSRFDERTWHCVAAHVFSIPFLVALDIMSHQHSNWGRYTCLLFVVGSPSYYPILLSWVSESCFSVKKRAIAVSTTTSLTIVGAIISAQAYQKSDAPYYHKGNKALIATAVVACALFVLQRWYLLRQNQAREQKWGQMSLIEQSKYQQETELLEFDGNKRLDFRFPL